MTASISTEAAFVPWPSGVDSGKILLEAGDAVFHILGPGRIRPVRMNEAVRPHPSGSLSYRATGV
jgi:hypothetical protein